jgi:hypothetical protein
MTSKDNFDFNIDNYTVEDIFALFNLDITVPLNTDQLRKAKHVLIRVHPDKSKLPREYFIFFNKAYNVLTQISECNQQRRGGSGTEYLANEYYSSEIHTHIATNSKDIRKVFNSRFEAINSDMMPQAQAGHGDWFRQSADPTSTISLSDHSTIFNKHKEKHSFNQSATAVTVLAATNMSDNIGFSMLDDTPTEFTSGMFGQLQFTDLKQSYTKSLFDISDNAFDVRNNRPQSIDELKHVRETTPIACLSIKQSEAIMADQRREETEMSTHRAYRLVRELERANIKNTQLTSQLLKY